MAGVSERRERGQALSSAPVPLTRRLAYALPAFGLAVVGLPVYLYMPKFYADVVGVPVAAIGAILLGVRIFDAFSDPLIGMLSDRTRSRFGRRRPWIVLGALPLALCIGLLFAPPALAADTATVWFAVSVFALFLFWTVVTVPYEALGVEISFDYDERTSLLALRDGILLLGTVVAVLSPFLLRVVGGLPDDAAGERERFLYFAVIYAPLVVLLCWIAAARVPERATAATTTFATGSLDGLASVMRNRPFGVLLGSYAIAALGSNLPATLILFYVEYVLQDDRAEPFLLMYFVTGIVLLPFWVWLARRIEKKVAWIAAMSINTGAFLGVFFLGAGQGDLYGFLIILSGVGFGGTLAIPSAMQADVIDYDELLSGRRREGIFIGAWSIARKLAAALGVGIALVVLGSSGYQPKVEQSPEAVFALRVMYALVPSVLNLIAIFVALAYPIDRACHRKILEALANRRAGKPWRDPVP